MNIVNRKRFAAILAFVMLLSIAVGVTVAYLIDSSHALVNTFTPTSVNVEITDTVNGSVKDNVVIKNTGTTNAYIRARIVGNWVSDNNNGKVVQAWNPEGDGTFVGLPGTGWVKNGDYYYYTSPVAPEGTTAPLFTSYTVTNTVQDAHLVMDILVQAIQSEGGAAMDAWKVDPSTPNQS